MVLDFLDAFPRDVRKALFLTLKSFSISSRILPTNFDGASESLVASKELAMLLLSHQR